MEPPGAYAARVMSPPVMNVIAPAYGLCSETEYEKFLGRGRLFADAAGLAMTPGAGLDRFVPQRSWLPADQRFDDLRASWECDVLWTCRGGYGCTGLLPFLEASPLPLPAPRLIGFSDVTALHAFWQRKGWGASIYGSMPESPDDRRALDSLLRLYREEPWTIAPLEAEGGRVLRHGSAEGPLFVACLSILAVLSGTPYMPDLRGHILAIEDIEEKPYQWDRSLTQLVQAGALDGVTGLIGGSAFFTPEPGYAGPSVDDIIQQWAERLEIPAVAGLPFGHLPNPLALPVGWQAALHARPGGSLAARPA